MGTFRKRWMSIKGHCLYSYKTEQEKSKPTEIIDLKLFKYIACDQTKFELIMPDKTKRVFIAPSIENRNKWMKCIKNAHEIQEWNASNAEKIELPNSKIIWNDTDKIWEYYWLSDGCGQRNIHRNFSCKEMFERNRLFFKTASEPIMFKRMDGEQWINSWSDLDKNILVRELKKYNDQHREFKENDFVYYYR